MEHIKHSTIPYDSEMTSNQVLVRIWLQIAYLIEVDRGFNGVEYYSDEMKLGENERFPFCYVFFHLWRMHFFLLNKHLQPMADELNRCYYVHIKYSRKSINEEDTWTLHILQLQWHWMGAVVITYGDGVTIVHHKSFMLEATSHHTHPT